jgi:hypothetical protein
MDSSVLLDMISGTLAGSL